MSELEFELFKLFTEYSMHRGTYKVCMLRVDRLLEMCNDACLFEGEFQPQHMRQLLQSSFRPGCGLSFPMFCELTAKISEGHFPSEFAESPVQAFDMLINEFLLPLARTVGARRMFISPEDLNLTNKIVLIAHNLYPSLRRIFENYFPWELKRAGVAELHSQSLKAFEKFLREVEIIPLKVNKTKVHGLWRDLVIMQGQRFRQCITEALIPRHGQDSGSVFPLSKFILSLYLLSIYCGEDGESTAEKFIGFLGRVQSSLSGSMRNLNLTVSDEVLEAIMHDLPGEMPTYDLSEVESSKIYEQYVPQLRKLFHHYSMDMTGLKRKAFLRLLKDGNLLNENLVVADVDIMYSKLTGRKLAFSKFLDSLEIIAGKVYPRITDGMKIVIEDHLLMIEFDVPIRTLPLKHYQKQTVVHSTASEIFFHFMEGEALMDFATFMRFCKSFEIFPEILSKYKLYNIFIKLSQKNNDRSETQVEGLVLKKRNESISLEEFTRALLVIAEEIWHEKECSDDEKICYLIYRISRSPGAARMNGRDKIAKALHERYPDFWGSKPAESSEFRDIINAINQDRKNTSK